MNSKVGSLEEKVKLPPTETISRCYQPQGGNNRKIIRILTVAVYVLCVSLAAIMLSLYYIFIWDPTIRPFVKKGNTCDKIVIPEKIAIRLLNSSEITAEQFYKHILEQYRILNQMQQQRQQFLQKQQLQLQQLAAGNRFQEIFATATIIQSNPSDPIKKPVTPTNGTFLLEPPPPRPMDTAAADGTAINGGVERWPILDTAPAAGSAAVAATATHMKRKQHRKHYNHHRHNNNNNNSNNNNNNISNSNTNNGARKNHKRPLNGQAEMSAQEQFVVGETPLNQPITVIQEPYTSMPIPLILNSKEDKRPTHHDKNRAAQAKKRTSVGGYESPAYLNPFLTGELIFEK